MNLRMNIFFPAGKATTDDELEEMLESGNSAVFTAGVSVCVCLQHPNIALCLDTDHDAFKVRKPSCQSLSKTQQGKD